MHSNLINKARNLTVAIHLRSGAVIVGRILDVDEVFLEVEVKRGGDGQFIGKKDDFDKATAPAHTDRVLINLADVSYIA